MTTLSKTTSTLLTYAGALPFWLLLAAPTTLLGVDTGQAFLAYGAVISAFMAGTLWGVAQMGKAGHAAIVASNVFALLSFATLLIRQPVFSAGLQLIVFALLLLADRIILANDVEHRWYARLRTRVTIIVVLAYIAMLYRLA
ncbi:uncharacterized protein DUF3429 [Rhizobium sp. PP-F2F-G38]|uniref:DUF3429 domain-containing protein n=1 Tax=Ferranicluibacter rubi TaxID=2715133 RepID=A0AA43ZG61_9HYPH|nr:DUF3429 domain-containing protein [Ferranicluibacter rubi]PYE34132.1 uncharacterized protein DUF3429 [Rhizobium sp. PP-WC-1G-195]PYE96768.1 uncharacterized protein DUF3429 [Rhizobium sp. PP-F2F-G38]TCP86181.1 uncharacterized protein DUF3429 [Rhizobium sp. PP-CC-2G-626]TCQ06066.1 uncharacterized protein DUF3429 [Rhizobium sp. PP-F2F-G36]TCQ23547.1 uncharacterized protein DUF3429 [Rhizobium sp. PP-CC-3G-465]